MTTEVSAGLDSNGNIVDWQYDVWSGTHSIRPAGAKRAGNLFAARQIAKPLPLPPVGNIPQPRGGGDRNAVPLYSFANQRITKRLIPDMPIRVSALRGLGAYTNVFSIESFMDEIAHAVGEDPIEFRIRHLNDRRAIGVLRKLREQMAAAGFDATSAPAGVGIAMAQYKNSGAYCAIAMRVVVDSATGRINLDRALCAVDVGLVINPDGAINQIEGGVIQSSSWTVKEQLRLGDTGVESRDWASYPILTFTEVPSVEVVLMDQPNEPALGAGEASQGPTAAAIANAVAGATGKRVRELPLTPGRLKKA
jgi:CO/xanthine dehydrogenase Mo-binding subunit